jgi:hypothetical protein
LKNFSLYPYFPISLYIFTIKYKNHTLVRGGVVGCPRFREQYGREQEHQIQHGG